MARRWTRCASRCLARARSGLELIASGRRALDAAAFPASPAATPAIPWAASFCICAVQAVYAAMLTVPRAGQDDFAAALTGCRDILGITWLEPVISGRKLASSRASLDGLAAMLISMRELQTNIAAMLYSNAAMLVCNAAMLVCNAAMLVCNAAMVICNAAMLVSNAAMLVCNATMLVCNAAMLVCYAAMSVCNAAMLVNKPAMLVTTLRCWSATL